MKTTDTAVELKKVIGSLVEKLDTKKYREFSLQLDLIIRNYDEDFSGLGIGNLSVLSDLYYMEGCDEQIKNILLEMDRVLDNYIVYKGAVDTLYAAMRKIVNEPDYIAKNNKAMSLCSFSIDHFDHELY